MKAQALDAERGAGAPVSHTCDPRPIRAQRF
jgi:hypothetical protein